MFKNITIGQFCPTSSSLHRLDPRTKIVLLLVFMVLIFAADAPFEYLVLCLSAAGCALLSKVPPKMFLRSLKPVALLVAFTAVLNLFMTRGGEEIFSLGFLHITERGVYLAVSMLLRVLLLITMSSLLTLTTTPLDLTNALEKLMSPLSRLHFPAHEIAMMMSIALRFIPTLAEETEKIMKAQISRGSDFEGGGIIAKAKAFLPLLVPLFVSAFRRADELACAMETRCYRGGAGRTSYKILKFSLSDAVAFLFSAVIASAIVCLKIFC